MAWSKKRMILALASAVIAAVAMAAYAFGVRADAVQTREQALASYGGEQVEVFVATRDIAAGETLGADNVSSQIWLSDLLPAGALTEQSEVFGQTVAISLLRNEPVVSAKLGVAAAPVSVPEGYCAVSIPTDDVLAVGGAIATGSVIMVYAAGPSAVELLADAVLVLDTSNGALAESTTGGGLFSTSSSRKALAWVTLAVEPHRVQELIAASRDKSLYLVLPGAGIGIEDLQLEEDFEDPVGVGSGSGDIGTAVPQGESHDVVGAETSGRAGSGVGAGVGTRALGDEGGLEDE